MAVSIRPAPGYDSGLTTLTAAIVELSAGPVIARSVLLCNLTAAKQTVTIQDRRGKAYLNAYPLQANMTMNVDLGLVRMDGISWQAGAADAVNAQLVGETLA